MSSETINVLFIADIIGQAGFDITASLLPRIKQQHEIHFTIANGENAASGKGITPHLYRQILDLGIDVMTSGNHIWDKDKIYPVLDETDQLLRPHNYPQECPGKGVFHGTTHESYLPITVISLQGKSFMYPIQCPFKTLDSVIESVRKKTQTKIIFVDFHAESTAEKIALGWHIDGRVSALVGTHTHVQTADEQILPNGTAYITDVGMTGPMDSVIGMDKASAIKRFITQMPVRYQCASGLPQFSAVVIHIDKNTGDASGIQRIQLRK